MNKKGRTGRAPAAAAGARQGAVQARLKAEGSNMDIKGKVCVVTGGASGIGEATARAFAKAGAKGVVVADLAADKLAAVARDINGLAVVTDVGKEADIKALVAAAGAKYGPGDIFFSNAGISRKGQEAASDADWDVSWRVTVMS